MATAPGSPLNRVIRWRGLDPASLEHCHIVRTERDTRIRGTIIAPDFGLFYRLKLDEAGQFRTLKLERTDGRTLELFADGMGNWSDDRAEPLPALKGCIDIDLSASPLTNALPIWRTAWTDAPQRFRMAWINAQTLSVEPDQQIYTRRDASHFHYQAVDNAFERTLQIDADGLVTDYPGLFTLAD